MTRMVTFFSHNLPNKVPRNPAIVTATSRMAFLSDRHIDRKENGKGRQQDGAQPEAGENSQQRYCRYDNKFHFRFPPATGAALGQHSKRICSPLFTCLLYP